MNLFVRYLQLKYAKKIENADDLLKKRIGPNDEVAQQLLKHDVIPIVAFRPDKDPKSQDTAFLGSGWYQKVFEVSYKGKLAVAKITDSQPDIKWTLLLNSLRAKLGNDAKYIMQVYHHFPIEINGKKEYTIVAEKLNPVNSHILSVVDYFALGSQKMQKLDWQTTKEYLYQSNILKTIKDEVILFVNLHTSEYQEDKSLFLQSLQKIITDALVNSNSFDDFGKILFKDINGFIYSYQTNHSKQIDYLAIKKFIAEIKWLIDKIRSRFPANYHETTPEILDYYESRPETKDFLRFLLRLKKEFGIAFKDLHADNIMQRSSTGDLVISDAGLFE